MIPQSPSFAIDPEWLPGRSANRAGWRYQTETLRPMVCLAFVLPFLLTYELGVIFLDHHAIRNGLDVWLHRALSVAGFSELLLLPLLTTFLLFAAHHFRGDRWQVSPAVLGGMVLESCGLALIVLFAARAQHLFWLQYSQASPSLSVMQIPATIDATPSLLVRFVAYCGAGLYEELVFRLLMLPGLILLLRLIGLRWPVAIAMAIGLTSLLFAAAHYDWLNPAAAAFEWPGFMVRFLASVFFALVFLFRGFGVAVGTHVAYDLLTHF